MATHTTLRRLQLVTLEILDVFVALCEKHNLCYFFTGGTLLGAVRHKGFIPWDDDIDVGMPRADYDKLVEICKKEQPSGYFLQEARTYGKYWHIYAKLRKDNSRVLEDNPPPFIPEEHRGLDIDIFPYDATSSDKVIPIQSAFLKKIRFLLFEKRGYRSESSALKKVCKKILVAVLPFSFLHWLAREISQCNAGTREKLSGLGGSYPGLQETYPREVIFPLAKLEFEHNHSRTGGYYWVPNNWDYFLTRFYGDYMTLPPEDKQKITHGHDVVFDVEKNDIGRF
jgi:lipopolysaccharide cholinephosphotransferase